MRWLAFNKARFDKGCAITIGNFDGVHLGHQAMLQELKRYAQAKELASVVVLFEPQPIEFFNKTKAPARLMTFRQKAEVLEELGMDAVVCLTFNERLAMMAPEQFVADILVRNIKAKYILVGQDFNFGYQRKGTTDTLKQLSRKYAYEMTEYTLLASQSEKISSTSIRQALSTGQLALAEKLLGRPYQISGRVMHGAKRGRLIGVPTANIRLKHMPLAVRGVFSVEVSLGSTLYKGVANIGFRPTVDGKAPQLEVHLFDFSGDLYGKRITVLIKHKIRNEKKFESFEALTTQIQQDLITAKQQLRISHEHV